MPGEKQVGVVAPECSNQECVVSNRLLSSFLSGLCQVKQPLSRGAGGEKSPDVEYNL